MGVDEGADGGLAVGVAMAASGQEIVRPDDAARAAAAIASEHAQRLAVVESMLDPHVLLRAVRDDSGRAVDFVYTDANDAACTYNRTTRQELLGSTVMELLPAHATTGLLEMYANVVDTGEPLILDDFVYPHEILAEPRHFDIRGVKVGDSISFTWRDVTDRVEQAGRVAASDQWQRLLLASMAEGVVVLDSDGRVISSNDAAQRILGLAADQLLGLTVMDARWQAVHPDGSPFPGQDHPASVALATGESVHDVVMGVTTADGRRTWVLVNAVALPAQHEQAAGGVIATFSDVTTQIETELALVAAESQALMLADRYAGAMAKARDANRAKTVFLSRMSHELRTPLNAVLGFAQLLALDPLTGDQQDAVEHIRRGGEVLTQLLGDVLDIARIEEGRLAMSLEPIAVADVVEVALDLLGPQVQAAGVTLMPFRGESCQCSVWADRKRLSQVLSNLLTNAVKYNRPAGTVEVACEEGVGGMTALRVTDTGRGIATEALERLFEPFDRLGAESSGIEGTGIGLALAHSLAQSMGGCIDVESTPGEGSTFTLILPSASPSPDGWPSRRPHSAVRHTAGSRSAGGRYLYIEDNPANQQLMKRIFGLRPEASLAIFDCGDTGVESALADPPDLVFLDLHLPGLDGQEVLRRLRSDHRTARVPVVIVTADAGPSVRPRLEHLGADGFLNKPIDIEEVLHWIDFPRRDGD